MSEEQEPAVTPDPGPPVSEEPAAEPQGGSTSGRPGIADAVADFIRMFVDYVRQETGDLVKDKVVLPTQKAGQVVAFALAAAGVLVLGIAFVSVGLLLVLADVLGWPGALFLIGGVLVLSAAVFTFLKTKRMQR